MKAAESTIDFGGFLSSLLICAQIKNNDTFKRSNAVLSSADSLQELFSRNILPFAVKMEYKSILKETFCTDELLYSLRNHHDDMFRVFEKYCTRGNVKDFPSSLRIDDMAAMMADAGEIWCISMKLQPISIDACVMKYFFLILCCQYSESLLNYFFAWPPLKSIFIVCYI